MPNGEDTAMALSPDDELDAAMAALQVDITYSQAVVGGVALRRPDLMDGLATHLGIPAAQLAAVRAGAAELTPVQIGRIEEITDLGALQLAGAFTGQDDDPDYVQLAERSARLGRLSRAARPDSDGEPTNPAVPADAVGA